MNKLFFVLVLLFSINASAHNCTTEPYYANLTAKCRELGLTCFDVSIEIITHEYAGKLIAGDTFHYNIILRLMHAAGNRNNFTIEIYNPLREKIYSSNKSVEYNGTNVIELQERTFGPLDKYTIIPLDSTGLYKLSLASGAWPPAEFYFFESSCAYRRSFGTFEYFFEAMPGWQHSLEEMLKNSSATSERLGKLTAILNAQVVHLTVALIFIGIANALFAAATVRWREKNSGEKILYVLGVILLTLAIFLFYGIATAEYVV